MAKQNRTYRQEDVVEALIKVGVVPGDLIFIHSNIGFFGFLEGANDQNDYYKAFKSAIFEVIENQGTLVVPTFTYSFCKGQNFIVDETPSACGIFSEMVRQDSTSIRSEDANFSVAAIGHLAKALTAEAPDESFGKGSFWDLFYKNNGKIVNFNFDAGSTFIHFVEKTIGVNYRYDKAFSGEVTSIRGNEKRSFFHFVYDLNRKDHSADFVKFDSLAKELGVVKVAALGRGSVLSISAKDTFKVISENLEENPGLLTKTDTPKPDPKSALNKYFDRLWPINRSLTGQGNRETLGILKEVVEDLEIREAPSGTSCFDWIVPPEWNCKEAWIKDKSGKKIVDFDELNIRLLGYSEPVHGTFSFHELKSHLHTLPDQPSAVPYLTSYYKKRWGFCLSQREFDQLDQEGEFEVYIDSTFKEDGSMTWGQAVIQGDSDEEILFTTYICHPSMANNELSGPLVTSMIYQELKKMSKLKYTYRFVFVPETIGSIFFLSQHGEHLRTKLKAGYVLTCVGDTGNFTYKKSRQGIALCDRAALHVLNQSDSPFTLEEFKPIGSDERQYCSPGFNLPVGSLMRTMYGVYPEYHTSLDNKSVISFEAMEGTVKKYLSIVEILENNAFFVNTMPYCEPQLGKRGLYPTLGSRKKMQHSVEVMMWTLNFSDGKHDLLEIANKSDFPFHDFVPVVKKLLENKILKLRE